MEEKKFVKLKKEEFGGKEFIKKELGKGKISSIKIEYTPVGEKITITTNKPGYVIGRKGSRIAELTEFLKKRFNLENPHIEIMEIAKPEFDAQNVADEIALSLERFGNMKFKVISYRMLERIVKAGALGVEIRLSGKLPGERAKSWRFANGYLKKTGDTAKIVNRANANARTLSGTVGIKVSILPPDAKIHDQINVNEEMLAKIKKNVIEDDEAKLEVISKGNTSNTKGMTSKKNRGLKKGLKSKLKDKKAKKEAK